MFSTRTSFDRFRLLIEPVDKHKSAFKYRICYCRVELITQLALVRNFTSLHSIELDWIALILLHNSLRTIKKKRIKIFLKIPKWDLHNFFDDLHNLSSIVVNFFLLLHKRKIFSSHWGFKGFLNVKILPRSHHVWKLSKNKKCFKK